MWPCLKSGDILLWQKCANLNYKAGKIYLLRQNQEIVAHRLVSLCEKPRFKGDCSFLLDSDDFVILGEVKKIKRRGKILKRCAFVNSLMSFWPLYIRITPWLFRLKLRYEMIISKGL